MTTPKVWIASRVSDDVGKAAEFGVLTHINTRYIYPDELVGANNELPSSFKRNMEEAVRSFNPDADYLLLAGDHLQLIFISALLASTYDRFRVLRWDRKLEHYVPSLIYGYDHYS